MSLLKLCNRTNWKDLFANLGNAFNLNSFVLSRIIWVFFEILAILIMRSFDENFLITKFWIMNLGSSNSNFSILLKTIKHSFSVIISRLEFSDKIFLYRTKRRDRHRFSKFRKNSRVMFLWQFWVHRTCSKFGPHHKNFGERVFVLTDFPERLNNRKLLDDIFWKF